MTFGTILKQVRFITLNNFYFNIIVVVNVAAKVLRFLKCEITLCVCLKLEEPRKPEVYVGKLNRSGS